MDRELLSTYGDGLHRDHRLPVRRGADPAPARPVRRGGGGGGGLPRHLRRRELLLRADGPRARHRAPGPEGPAAPGPRPGPAAGRHQRPALHPGRGRQGPRGAAVRAVRLDAGRPEPVQVRRRRLLPQVRPPRCGTPGASCPRRATTRCSSPSGATCRFTEGEGRFMPRFPCPEGEDETSWFVKEVETRPARALPGGHPRRRAPPGRVRDRGHRLARATPATSSSSPTSSTGPRSTASGSARVVAPAPARCAPTR